MRLTWASITLILLWLVAGCQADTRTPTAVPAPTSTPTPDVPRFAKGEAIAVVQTYLSSRKYSSDLDCLTAFLRYYPRGTWGETYQRGGVWTVQFRQLDAGITGVWKVYEGSLAVRLEQSGFGSVC